MLENVKDGLIEGVKILKFKQYEDSRGWFSQLFHEKQFEEMNLPTKWAQSNMSYSRFNVIRGAHIQSNNPQGKLIHCPFGYIEDFWVDLRPDSPTFKMIERVILSGMNGMAVYLPAGLAHGFWAKAECNVLSYMCTTPYDKESDGGVNIRSLDFDFISDYPFVISEKDQLLPSLDEYLKGKI